MPIPTSFFRSETSQRLREEGRVEGRAEAKAAQALGRTIIRVLEARELEVSEVFRERVFDCVDLKVLDRWFRLAILVAWAEAIFVAPLPPPRVIAPTVPKDESEEAAEEEAEEAEEED
ncbi:hypothetical protein [Streptomyces sp. NBC_01190]|uniref:hypothetical protein n=1 Tax=Streptomyces sp. NBC_01190 TaxID=2903767 RepID=UPI00386B43D6|nr:hypothetical protein OG519_08190 [Streptomyces sp. NBC_01190]